MKRILLLSFGSTTYGSYAFNLAASIRYYSGKGISIKLLHDKTSVSHFTDFHSGFFDSMEIIPDNILYKDGKICPEQVKINYYSLISDDEYIYLDVDSIATKDIRGLFDECRASGKDYLTQVHNYWTLDNGAGKIENMAWAMACDIWRHFELSDSDQLPCTQSSFAYIKRGNATDALFGIMQKYLSENPFPVDKLEFKWGGGQPDELYLNACCAKLGIKPDADFTPMYFDNHHLKMEEVEQSYFIGLFGGRGMTSKRIIDYSDRLMHRILSEGWNVPHLYKYQSLVKNKHANKK